MVRSPGRRSLCSPVRCPGKTLPPGGRRGRPGRRLRGTRFLGALEAGCGHASGENLLQPPVHRWCGRPAKGDRAAGEGPSGNKNPLLLPAGPCLAQSLLTDQTRDSGAFRAEVARSPLGGQGSEGEGGRLLRPHRWSEQGRPSGPGQLGRGVGVGARRALAGETQPGFLQQREGLPASWGLVKAQSERSLGWPQRGRVLSAHPLTGSGKAP